MLVTEASQSATLTCTVSDSFFKIALKAQGPSHPLVEHLSDRCWEWWRWQRTPCTLLIHRRHMWIVTGRLGLSFHGGLREVSSLSVKGILLLKGHMTPTCKNSFLYKPIRTSPFRANSFTCLLDVYFFFISLPYALRQASKTLLSFCFLIFIKE